MNSKHSPSNKDYPISKQKQRSTHSQTPNKHRTLSTTNLIHLSQYFAKRNTNPATIYTCDNESKKQLRKQQSEEKSPQNLNKIRVFNDNKENMSPNTNRFDNKDMGDKKSGKKSGKNRIITIKSNLKSKQRKRNDQSFNGYSTEKRSITESIPPDTDITAFDSELNHRNLFTMHSTDQLAKNSLEHKKPVVIELDLYKHRKSIQDTLLSSGNTLAVDSVNSLPNHEQSQKSNKKGQNPDVTNKYRNLSTQNYLLPEENQQVQFCSNSNHFNIHKIATFRVKGKPYCDKCAANFITNGQLAIRIRNTNNNTNKNLEEVGHPREQQERTIALNSFIQKLDLIQPKVEQLRCRLIQDVVPIIEQKYSRYYEQIKQWKKQTQQLIDRRQNEMFEEVCSCHQQIMTYINTIKGNILEELNNINFMRTDIIQNINSIVKPGIVKNDKFMVVLGSFEEQLQVIRKKQQEINNTQVSIPNILKWNYSKQQQNINKSIIIEYRPEENKYLFDLKCVSLSSERLNTNSSDKRRRDSEENPYRLSFGKEIRFSEKKESMQSPTFKMI